MSEVFEPDEVLEQIGGSTELLREMIEIFQTVYPDDVQRIEESIRSGDAEAVRRAVHRMKGSVSNFGKRRAYQLSLRMEEEARNNDLTRMDGLLSELKEELDALLAELYSYTVNA
ncbi:MAG: Hpt domain-containing protein [Candidatus Thermoplasmatota archaeon]|jgi:HPt (histidine-containing phosphotransfer) domain-containing protein|nr:Hpt domain-containing protein [Candidatus Thermoplasmatota archaeon]